MARLDRLQDQGAGDAGLLNKAMRPMNDVERLEQENEKLRALINQQESELLNVYRQLNSSVPVPRDRY